MTEAHLMRFFWHGWLWLAPLLWALAVAEAEGQCFPVDPAAHCRIHVADGSAGSGTLVEVSDNAGLIITCAHLFRESQEGITVAFPGGQSYQARLLHTDPAHDLATLVIAKPNVKPVTGVADIDAAQPMAACGFGTTGRWRSLCGQMIARQMPKGATHPSAVITSPVEPGDSGGGVINQAGELLGVIWGGEDGMAWFTDGQPVWDILAKSGARVRKAVRAAVAPQRPSLPPDTPSVSRDTYEARGCRCEENAGKLGALEQAVADLTTRFANVETSIGNLQTTLDKDRAEAAGWKKEIDTLGNQYDGLALTLQNEYAKKTELKVIEGPPGEPGAPGPQGPQGLRGAAGAAATLAMKHLLVMAGVSTGGAGIAALLGGYIVRRGVHRIIERHRGDGGPRTETRF